MAKLKFAPHQVVGRVGYGIGVQLALTETQIHDRLHALVVDDEKAGLVTVTEPIEFRPGEIIGIAHALSRHEEAMLVPAEKPAKRGKQPNNPKDVASAGEGNPNADEADDDGDGEPDDEAEEDGDGEADDGDADRK